MLPLVAFIALTRSSHQDSVLPDTVPARRLSEMLTAMNTRDEEKIDAMVRDNFAKSALKLTSKEEWVSRIVTAGKALAPVSVDAVIQSSDSTIIVRLKTRALQPSGLRIDLEPETPFGIINAHLGTLEEVVNGTAPKKYTDWKTLYELAEEIRKDNRLPAMCVAYEQGGKPPEAVCVGVRNKQNPATIRLDDRLLIGEIGKSMTATLVAYLIDIKKMSWTTTLGEVLDNVKMADAYKTVTIDQLLHNKANLPPAPTLTTDQLTQIIGKAESPTDMRKNYVASLLLKPPVEGSSGLAANTDADYVVVGYLVEKLMNKPYEWLMQRHVFDPMKMNSAFIAPVGSDEQVGSQNGVFGHILGDLGYVPYQMPITDLDSIMAPAGHGVSCSIEDLLKFAGFHLRGLKGDAKVLSADSYKRLHTPDADTGEGKQALGWTVDPMFSGEPCQYERGTDGTFYADLTIWPDSNIAAVAVTNAGTARQPSPTMQAIIAIKDKLEKH